VHLAADSTNSTNGPISENKLWRRKERELRKVPFRVDYSGPLRKTFSRMSRGNTRGLPVGAGDAPRETVRLMFGAEHGLSPQLAREIEAIAPRGHLCLSKLGR